LDESTFVHVTNTRG